MNFEVLSVNTVMEFADKGFMIVMVFVFFSPVFGFIDIILYVPGANPAGIDATPLLLVLALKVYTLCTNIQKKKQLLTLQTLIKL